MRSGSVTWVARDPAAMRALKQRARDILRDRDRERLQRDRQRVHLRLLAAAIARWASVTSAAWPSPLALLAGEVLQLHQELALQRQLAAAAAAQSERDGFRRGFVVARGR